jgi:aspartate carbamoyltransferase catalytic subunit
LPDASQFQISLQFFQHSNRTFHSFYLGLLRLNNNPVISPVVPKNDLKNINVSYKDELNAMAYMGINLVISRTNFKVTKEDIPNNISYISAGNDILNHPSQALVDFAVLRKMNLLPKSIVIMGNHQDHRAGKSFALIMQKHYPDILIDYIEHIDESNTIQLEKLKNADLIYQLPYKSWSNMNATGMQLNLTTIHTFLKPTCKIMHPFPRHEELSPEVDHTKWDLYTEQSNAQVMTKARLCVIALGLTPELH